MNKISAIVQYPLAFHLINRKFCEPNIHIHEKCRQLLVTYQAFRSVSTSTACLTHCVCRHRRNVHTKYRFSYTCTNHTHRNQLRGYRGSNQFGTTASRTTLVIRLRRCCWRLTTVAGFDTYGLTLRVARVFGSTILTIKSIW